MAKRKFGASIIILCIAAVTLISGTYAWFMVGGWAELFDIGFDVMKAGGGILVQGDANSAENQTKTWGESLYPKDFLENSFIDSENNGKYKPISSLDGRNFIYVTMKNNKFTCDPEPVRTKSDRNIEKPEQVCFNDFTLFIKSSTEDSLPGGAYMTIKLGGHRYDESTGEKIDDIGAAKAAKVAVTINDGTPAMYSLDGQDTNAVTSRFADDTIIDAKNPNQNYIIDSADEGYGEAHLEAVASTALEDAEGTLTRIQLGEIPSSNTNGTKVRVQIWLEGNDPECIAFGEGAVAGKGLTAKIEFNTND